MICDSLVEGSAVGLGMLNSKINRRWDLAGNLGRYVLKTYFWASPGRRCEQFVMCR